MAPASFVITTRAPPPPHTHTVQSHPWKKDSLFWRECAFPSSEQLHLRCPRQGVGRLSICPEDPAPGLSLQACLPRARLSPPPSLPLLHVCSSRSQRPLSALKAGGLGMAPSVSPRCRSPGFPGLGLRAHVEAALATSSHPRGPSHEPHFTAQRPRQQESAAEDRRRERALSVSWVTMWIVIKTKTQN